MDRASPKLLQRKSILDMISNDDWSNISSLLNGFTTNNIYDDDLANFDLSISTMSQWYANGLDLHNLPKGNLDVLVSIAQLSYGDYSAILRGFLNAHYDLIIIEPVGNINLNEYIRDKETSYIKATNRLMIVPNPTSDCFRLQSHIDNEELLIKVIDLNGKIVMNKSIHADQDICLGANNGSSIYLVKYVSVNTGDSGTLKLMIK